VDHDELLRRLDAHMERGNRIMARSNEVMLRNEIAFRDLRDFLAEQTLAMRGLTREVLGMSRRTDEMVRRTDEILAEGRAQRQALFRLLDRLDGQGGPAAGEAS
jgi:hypothetical protein